MSKLSRDDVLKLANLSQLSLTDEEVERFSAELSSILEYVEQLKKVDTKNLEPTYQVTGLTNVMRPDRVLNYGAAPKDLLDNAPELKDGYFKVKRVLS